MARYLSAPCNVPCAIRNDYPMRATTMEAEAAPFIAKLGLVQDDPPRQANAHCAQHKCEHCAAHPL
ncbi:hypothetical protein HaLaN_28657 [Haematococcus lacustris]|uniref:Uncharacterized protein n=1 Tax=Haematococcus lacustris TaxID=44745 RepID=A0A6A0ADG8_HAELA|nr:hypothetical protein HaLaN_28657 [Haematococcus lacustris]